MTLAHGDIGYLVQPSMTSTTICRFFSPPSQYVTCSSAFYRIIQIFCFCHAKLEILSSMRTSYVDEPCHKFGDDRHGPYPWRALQSGVVLVRQVLSVLIVWAWPRKGKSKLDLPATYRAFERQG